MSSKITDYLNEHLSGDVVSGDNARRQFSTDGSVLSLMPNLVIHPREVDDIRKIARFTWRLAERGQILPLTARGNGVDQTGAALSRGVILSTPAHMAQIMEFELKYRMVRVQPGISLETLGQAVLTQGMRLPIDGGISRAMTVGGAIANNAPGRQYAKYGAMGDWVEKLEVVLANGEIIQTGRISQKELNRCKGLQTLEGEIYRSIDSLILDNPDTISALSNRNILDAGGYRIEQVKGKDGSFDLTPLFLGSQGTLGIISQAIIHLTELSSSNSMVVAALNGEQDMPELVAKLIELEPSALEFIDGATLELLYKITGYEPWSSVCSDLPAGLIFVEFEGKHTARKSRQVAKLFDSQSIEHAKIASSIDEYEQVMNIYDSVSAITNHNDSGEATIPLMSDISILPSKAFDLVDGIRKILKRNHVEAGIWGNLAAGLVTVKPIINLTNLGQRQIIFRLMDQISELVRKQGGSITGLNGGGRLLSPWIKMQYDRETAELFDSIKRIFDPYGVLNTGVQNDDMDRNKLMAILRQDYINDRFSIYNLRG